MLRLQIQPVGLGDFRKRAEPSWCDAGVFCLF